MDNVLVFSHEQDVDGIFSAAILKIAFPNSEIILTNYGLQNMLNIRAKIYDSVQKCPPGTIIISDIGVNQESYGPVMEALLFSKDHGWKNIWIDHHPWSDDALRKVSEVCELVLYTEKDAGKKKCASELCAERFAPDSQLAHWLAVMAHRTDFPDSTRFPIPPLSGLISYYLGFRELYTKLYMIIENARQGILWNIDMQRDIIQSSKLIDESLARAISGMSLIDLNNKYGMSLKVAIAKSDLFLNRSLLLGKIIEEKEVDIAVAFTEDGKVSIRRGKNIDRLATLMELSCNGIAQEFREGGGHDAAAGGFLRVKPENTVEGDKKANEEILEALGSYLLKQTRTEFLAIVESENLEPS